MFLLSIKDNLKKVRRRLISEVIHFLAQPAEVTAGSLLIIAPHPDDETFACGGLIAQKKIKEISVRVVYLTDGKTAHKGCCNTSPDKIAFARRRLAEETGEILGLKSEDMFWLGLSDGMIPRRDDLNFKTAVAMMIKLLNEIKPKEVYAPHYLDCWPDHETASVIVKEALKKVECRCELYCYPVWMWHNLRLRSLPEVLQSKIFRIDITKFLDKKTAAVDHYLSALNPECGKPYCGMLPEGFIKYFQYPYEIFFKG
jgi:N-acetylglucosamine malate deacetylase 1